MECRRYKDGNSPEVLQYGGKKTAEVYLLSDNWIFVSNFCLEFVVSSEDDEPKPRIVSITPVTFVPPDNKSVITFYCLTISSVFMVLVLLVYIALPELRNLGGMILMAYITSLLISFILLAMMQRIAFPKPLCIYKTALLYFVLLASFCWMNIMSVDIWWTFRGYAKARPIHRRGERFKFFMYCIYGWGLPGIMTIVLVAMNEANNLPSHIIRPRIPDGGCNFLEDEPRNVYLYIPMTILILSNWVFFLMTAYNIRRLMRGTGILSSDSKAAGNPTAHRKQKLRLMVYVKLASTLSVIMGVSWLFETLSITVGKNHFLWQISDIFNMFIGVTIFLIFVFKKKIYYKLKVRFYELCTHSHKENSIQMTTKNRTSESNSQSALSRTSQL
ncbi:G-protein coupled receptor Mth2-like [Maniola jurtina]|uniref:G-protein coupled receptor Mth2-like n=1 Tax=Maniola jurtina TaxID=191418 RepID=UPI001E68E80E|nr:G-protein coupled receptor Mth2-like [Maniola jurtina]